MSPFRLPLLLTIAACSGGTAQQPPVTAQSAPSSAAQSAPSSAAQSAPSSAAQSLTRVGPEAVVALFIAVDEYRLSVADYKYRIKRCDDAHDRIALRALLTALHQRSGAGSLRLSADKGTRYADIVDAMDSAYASRMGDIGIGVVSGDTGAEAPVANSACGALVSGLRLPPQRPPLPPVIVNNKPADDPPVTTRPLAGLSSPSPTGVKNGQHAGIDPKAVTTVVLSTNGTRVDGKLVAKDSLSSRLAAAKAAGSTGVVFQAELSMAATEVQTLVAKLHAAGFDKLVFAAPRSR